MTGAEFRYQHIDHLVERVQIFVNRIRSVFSKNRRPVRVRRLGGHLFEIRVEGQTILAPWIQRWRFYQRGFNSRLEEVSQRYGLYGLFPADKDTWVIDVGAYMGEWTIFMLRRGFNVLAIEPDPDAARCLKENLEFHGPYEGRWLLDGRICHDRPGPVTLYLEPHKADSSLFPSTQRISKPVTLQADTLDHIVAERIGERSIHALKMDAEGAEPEALVGAAKTLAQCCFVGVDASCERLGQSTMNECRRILEDRGFMCRRILGSENLLATRQRAV